MDGQRDSASAARSAHALSDFIKRVGGRDRPERTARLEAAASEALAAFEARGVRSLLLKGPALARMLYGPDEHRRFSDVDLLVAEEDLPEAKRTLGELGYSSAEERTGIDDVGGAMHSEIWVRPGVEGVSWLHVDLHWRLDGSSAPASVAWAALAARRTWIDLEGGRRVPVLDPAGLALHVALHAAQHAREKPMRDLALALERWSPDVWRGAATLAEKLQATEAFAAGLRLLPEGREIAGVLGLPDTAALSWAIEHRDARPRGTFHLDAFAEAQTVRERLDVVRRSLLPRRDWIVSEHPWARDKGPLRLIAAYGTHLLAAPAWALRAWRFRRAAKRATG